MKLGYAALFIFLGFARLFETTEAVSTDPRYDCNNGRSNDTYCEANKSLCSSSHPKDIDYMHENCAHTCGFCMEQNCFDHALGCEHMISLCNSPTQSGWFRTACPKTCHVCVEQGRTESTAHRPTTR
ncbi:hypothetical protein L596_026061 [Steinernema carpocapsae]|uniref:ShKT domain-containing protein n=1 Tax=Steinernema carpocapsae TaxID=34508 RepID=A0A4U5M086_STECR|nr:hypothetical protein L596_026061 [Steinernema carpocapsae]